MAVKRTDIHTHILPCIDDGAKSINESLNLLNEQKKQGVNQIIFTPHFRFEKNNDIFNDVKRFIVKRENSLKLLTENNEFKELSVLFKCGAEVYYSVNLAECILLDDLSISGTNYILVELPTQSKPHGLTYVMNNIINKGYIPIIAHIERYSYIMNDVLLLYDLVDSGCLAQINSEVFKGKGHGVDIIIKMIKCGLVHFISSDCHSINKRVPNLDEGYLAVKKKVGEKYMDMLEDNSNLIFDNKVVEISNIRKPINIFGAWI